MPRVELARDAGLDVDNGIVVNEQPRDVARRTSSPPATSRTPGIRSTSERIRVEHWANALNQGPAAARAMLGEDVSYDRIPYFFSDQYDVGMEYSGLRDRVGRGRLPRRSATAASSSRSGCATGACVAGMNVNVWDVNEHVQALIRSRQPVDARRAGRPRHAARVARREAPPES